MALEDSDYTAIALIYGPPTKDLDYWSISGQDQMRFYSALITLVPAEFQLTNLSIMYLNYCRWYIQQRNLNEDNHR